MFDALSRFVVVWLHLTPMWPYVDVTIWDASPWCRLLHAYLPLFHSTQWYSCHAYLCHLLAFYASLHICSHVHAWVLLASESSMLQHNEIMVIQPKTTFVPRGHHLLYPFLIVCLFSCLLVILLFCLLAHLLASLFLCLPCISCLSALCLFTYSLHPFLPLLVCWFLVFAFACTHMEGGCMELGHGFLGISKKGVGASMLIWTKRLCSVGLGV